MFERLDKFWNDQTLKFYYILNICTTKHDQKQLCNNIKAGARG